MVLGTDRQVCVLTGGPLGPLSPKAPFSPLAPSRPWKWRECVSAVGTLRQECPMQGGGTWRHSAWRFQGGDGPDDT